MFCGVKKPVSATLAHARVSPPVSIHNSGQMKATRHGATWILIHNESFATRREAVRRELYYKTGRGRDELDAFM